MKRTHCTLILVLGILSLLVLDQQISQPLNPYQSPPAIALGSGVAGAGGFCSALPDSQ